MPPHSPLPQRLGLDPAWIRTPDRDSSHPLPWQTMGDWLHHKLSEFIDVPAFLAEERFVYEAGVPAVGSDPYQPHTFVWFHRDLSDETFVPGPIHVVHRDERIIVIDKPAFLSSIPRGRHVQQSVVVRLRAELGLSELSPLHRLDRVTSGLLILATEKRWRGAYQTMFMRGEVGKIYRALAPLRPELELPVTVRNHLAKERGQMQAEVVPGAPVNAESLIELETKLPTGLPTGLPTVLPAVPAAGLPTGLDETGVYRLTPTTGRTHQLRMHMLGLGIPISGDPLYPVVRDVAVDNFETPLQLLASEMTFIDPVDGGLRHFESVRSLPLLGEAVGGVA